MCLFFFCTVVIIFFSYTLLKALGALGAALIENIVKISVLSIFIILFITFVLGFLFKKYSAENIVIICFVLLGLLIGLARRFAIVIPAPISSKIVKTYIREMSLSKVERFAVFVIFATLIFKLISVFLLKVVDWDGSAYHVPGLVDYIQMQKIELVEKSIWSNVYPRNIEMLNMWTLVFKRDMLLIKLPQYLITFLGGVAIYGILKQQKIQFRNCVFGALIYMTTPIVLAQMTTSYIDISMTSLIITCIYFMVLYVERKSLDLAGFIGILFGIIIGIKYSAVAYVAVMAVAFILCAYDSADFKKSLKHILVTGIISLSLGSVWYVFNYVKLGNPLYPFEISAFNYVFFEGISVKDTIMAPNVPPLLAGKNPVIQVIMSWLEFFPNYAGQFKEGLWLRNIAMALKVSYDERIGGFGINWILIMVPSFFVMFFRIVKNKKINKSISLTIFVPLILFFICPGNWWTRYAAVILLTGIFSYIYLLDKNAVNRKIHTVFVCIMCFNCLFGSMTDIISFYTNIDKNGFELSITDFRNSQFRTEFTEEMSELVNAKPRTIVSLLPDITENLSLQGFKTQNVVKWYSQGSVVFESIDGLNKIVTKEQFFDVLNAERPDIVLLGKDYYKETYPIFFNEYNENGLYSLFKEYDYAYVYERAGE